ncbi:MAG TPA: Fis family transcriptional regulator [Chromatiaceae bacterium]|nr:Fis family transcriptional regulator [Chromatiaceae bacterium]
MIEEEGVVVSVQGEFAKVRIQQQRSACGSCSARQGCGTSLLARLFPERERALLARNPAAARKGDHVVIGLREADLQLASVVLYLLPVLGLISGALLGHWLAGLLNSADGELLSILLGSGMLALVLLWIRRGNGFLVGHKRFQAVILRVERAPPLTANLQVRT